MFTREELKKRSIMDQIASSAHGPVLGTGDDRLASLRGFSSVFKQISRTPEMLRRLMDPEFCFQGQVDYTHGSVPEEELLRRPWFSSTFVIPNYSNMPMWVQKMAMECEAGKTVVAIIPNRSNTSWFHEYVLDKAWQVRFVRGRLTFPGFSSQSPFPDAIVIYHPHEKRPTSRQAGEEDAYLPAQESMDVRAKGSNNRRPRVMAIMSSMTEGTEVVEEEEEEAPPPPAPKKKVNKLVTRGRGRKKATAATNETKEE